jgi:8-oxo-dGTP diphosphatase
MTKEVIRVVAAVVEDEGRYLITQRKPTAVLPLLWEFPGGRVEMGESDEDALEREVEWRIGIQVEVAGKLGDHIHEYEHYDVHMTMYECHLQPGPQPRAVNVNDLRWVPSTALPDYEFPPADEKTMDKLLGLSRSRS